MQKRSNEEWVAALKQDDSPAQEQALKDLGDYLYPVVYTYIIRRSQNLLGLRNWDSREYAALAEDFVQDALLRVLDKEKLEQYSGRGRFLKWAEVIIIRIAAEEFRRERWKSTMSFEQYIADHDHGFRPLLKLLSSEDLAPDKRALLQEIMEVINHIIGNKFSSWQRQVFLARDVDGYSNAEIAKKCGCKVESVKNALFEAHRKIRQGLLDGGYNLDDISAIFDD